MAIDYECTITTSLIFKNAYSYMQLSVTPKTGTQPARYAALSKAVANDEHVQRVFERNQGTGIGTAAAIFDIYFPLFPPPQTIDVFIYPEGTDPKTIDDRTPSYQYSRLYSTAVNGSALLLGLEDKEKNVRLFPTAGSGTDIVQPPATYSWTGTTLPDATDRISDAIVHLTELYRTTLMQNATFKANGASITPVLDPSTSKYHLYFKTGTDGMATLDVLPGNVPCSGHLIYWPFADNASEAARIVVYDPYRFGVDIFGPIPDQNPVTIKDHQTKDGPSFTIQNKASPQAIDDSGSIYFVVNDGYEKTVQATSDPVIHVTVSTRQIDGAPVTQLPQSNTARYIYAKENGGVATSPKYSFFAFLDPSP